jgi:topoisomerase-4 subunit A
VRAGKTFMTVENGDEVIRPAPVPEKPGMAVTLSENSRMLVFAAEELKELGRGRGIKLMGLDDKEKLVAVGFSGKESVTVTGISPRADKEKTVTIEGEDLQKYVLRRARKGRLLPGKLKPIGVVSDASTK